MRTSKSTLFLLVCFVYLCCFVQQCHQFAFFTVLNLLGIAGNMMNHAIANAITMSAGMFIHVVGNGLQALASAVGNGFMTLHTMTTSLVSGFVVGNLALAGFILFLLAVVPAEEERRSLGGNSLFTPLLPYYNSTDHRGVPLIPYVNVTDHRGIPLILDHRFNDTLVRNRRSLLVNSANATSNNTAYGDKFTLPESIVKDLNSTDRIPRFLTRLVQQDPFNCLPLLLCGLSASRQPSERTETLNDYAYLLKEFLRPESSESAEYDEEDENERKKQKDSRRRSSLKILNQLVQGGLEGKQKDEVDKLIEEMQREEDERLEELALTEMAEDPNDLRFALEDMKVRGLKKTVSKIPTKNSKKKYLSKLMGRGDVEEDEEYMGIADEEDPDVQMALLGRYERPQYDEGGGGGFRGDVPYPVYYSDPVRGLTRGGFPKAPPAPPVPEYGGSSSEELYMRNVGMLGESLEDQVPQGFMRRRMGRPPRYGGRGPPPMMGQGRRRMGRDVKHTGSNRAYLQKKRGEAAQADNIFDKTRVATEVGTVTRNNRQCRALFNECPVQTIARPVAQAAADTVGGAPFLNRAVNNIRRVILGGPSPETSKAKRVNEIKEAIQQLNPASSNGGGSEVKVVLNIGPTPLTMDHRAGGMPAAAPGYMPMQNGMQPQMMYMPNSMEGHSMNTLNMAMMKPTQLTPQKIIIPKPSPTGFSSNLLQYTVSKKPLTKRPATSKPAQSTTKKTILYKNPSSSPASKPLSSTNNPPAADLEELEKLLKTTMPPEDDEPVTVFSNVEQTTTGLNTFSDIVASMEQDEPSVEDDLVLPTKYPITKEEYAQGLRETFKLFDKFKEAHKTPVVVTIGRATVKPPTTTTSTTTTRKPPNKKKGGSKKVSKPKKKTTGGEKGEQADLEDGGSGEEKDLGGLLNWFQKLTSGRNKKGKKGKGKKKGEESSEESSEEEERPPPHPTLVAVPPRNVRNKIHWREGTSLVKDGVYNFLFGKRVTKPLPPIPKIPQDVSGSSEENEHEGKPIRHDAHYYEGPHHDLSGGEEMESGVYDEEPELDIPHGEHLHEVDSRRPTVYHRLRTMEVFEKQIPNPPPIPKDDIGESPRSKKRREPDSSGSSSESSPVLIATRRPMKKQKLKKPRPLPKPEPEPSSYEEENEQDYSNKPQRFSHYDSRSTESYEEENEEDDPIPEEPKSPKLEFTQFSLVRKGNKMKLKSKGGVKSENSRKTPTNKPVGKKKRKKDKSTVDKTSQRGKNDLVRRTSVGNMDPPFTKKKSIPTPTKMTRVKGMSTTTVKPKRKVLKYKNG